MQKIYYHDFLIAEHTYLLGATNRGLAFVGSWDKGLSELQSFYPEAELIDQEAPLRNYYIQLKEYLEGTRKTFKVAIDISGTEFQKQVWHSLRQIPYGQTTNYSQIAQSIGRPQAVRAVGSAIGKNPLLIIVPCHRVLTKSGKLGGYRGGTIMKKDLLKIEAKHSQ
ncbi:methylated-DNA--[protein]-cysteine S-methyltransferase [Companilactobacillus crustorum]|uniref:methylated-DNA--[protein]-cysteine S-methyltransferase n=3 Tax=Companilactobacillus TaxID=2767879 RepID=A0A837RKR3_9LACO|nr:methylated-DNA--[protein]-cysteine S-methyltransferase [Companilactobacillus crustorum]APU71406.1 Methylated-DNA--protein-cysteine methyltransferase, inducible [Companilactobacillus crustorum]KRK43814.1 methylated DNA-protein cysteine methyltransferase [Companilactobacillus crustorum JCM 15951]KRO21129.1 methylated DNA-protein cysteine methyltransferase [Companilactobacillus crustorum]WDT66566.1 methylated-DNA--[protein]-cysteine S-methyltransferase [Companilactobacillus crustorum]GEO76712.